MRVYLDWNATTPPLPEVIDAIAEVAKRAWANPSSVHGEGRAARAIVEDARAQVGALTGANVRDVTFTASATESNNLALESALACRPGALVTSRLEHPSVAKVAERAGARARWVRAKPDGTIDLEDLERVFGEGPVAAVAVQAVNHETGVIQPVREVMRLAQNHGAWLHVDAAQAWGKVPVDLDGVSSASVAPHKLRGPKGIGALVTAPHVKLRPWLVGGSQERGARPGTVDPALAAGFGVAAKHAQDGPLRYAKVAALRDALESELVARGARVNGTAARAPHVTSLAFAGWLGPELVAALDLEGVACSSGSACSAGTADPSPVIVAMHDPRRATESVRLSLGDETSATDVEHALAAFGRVLRRLK